MSLNDIDLTQVEEPKDFGAVKAAATRLRIRGIETKPAKKGKTYASFIEVQTEFVDSSSVEPLDPGTVPSAPIVNLYTHNAGSLQGLRRFIEAHGYNWADFVGSSDREGFLKGMIGAEANVKITVETKNKTTGEDLSSPRNQVRYLSVKKTA